MAKASGSFSVKITPQAPEDGVGDPAIARMALHKQFEGELQGQARGQMLAIRGAVDGSAAYVALDRFEGELHGRHGGFSLHHRGLMDRGQPSLEVRIVPDSGSGELEGISGTLAIRIEDKQHFYDLEYQLADRPGNA
ncbi:MAG: DUF3224 domain-containing protein [Arenimonas sp.]